MFMLTNQIKDNELMKDLTRDFLTREMLLKSLIFIGWLVSLISLGHVVWANKRHFLSAPNKKDGLNVYIRHSIFDLNHCLIE
jgi:hypothetical protein